MEEGAEQQQPQQRNNGVVLDEEAIFFKQEQRRETAARRKRRRAEEKTEQVKRLKSQEGKADESDKKFLECLKKLKVKELKVLCESNYLFKSGSKPQLIERIFSTKKHGGAGPCPNCAHNLFIFYNKRTHDPNSVECRNTSLYGESCTYNAKITRSNKATVLSHKLRDTKDGFLLSVGITLDQ
mmetsp:Transcript_36288/g.58273  ORF Transcript_36288/g.58273 Transcript_36288/m.58273 type:complete len:183 (+) Transcript_36288:166-714(+)|eukprot:jgi/Bigna1/86124/estExt_fgenesh1_pg.C_80136